MHWPVAFATLRAEQQELRAGSLAVAYLWVVKDRMLASSSRRGIRGLQEFRPDMRHVLQILEGISVCTQISRRLAQTHLCDSSRELLPHLSLPISDFTDDRYRWILAVSEILGGFSSWRPRYQAVSFRAATASHAPAD